MELKEFLDLIVSARMDHKCYCEFLRKMLITDNQEKFEFYQEEAQKHRIRREKQLGFIKDIILCHMKPENSEDFYNRVRFFILKDGL